MILVTGASGLLGANLVLYLQQRGNDVVALYHRHKFIAQGVKSLCVDLTDEYAVSGLLESLRPRWIIHCASLTNVDYCEEHPVDAFRVNAVASGNLAAMAHLVGSNLVYISTDSVFDGEEGHYSEEDTPAPVNEYAKSKLEGEKFVRHEMEHSLIIRTNIYGWNMQKKRSLVEWILNRLELNLPVPGFQDVVFAPILVNDLSEIILGMMRRNLTGLYHVTGSQSCSKYEFALLLADVFGRNRQLVQSVSVKDSFLKAPRPRNTSLRTDKISRTLNKVMPDVVSGLKHFEELRDSGFVVTLRDCRGDQ